MKKSIVSSLLLLSTAAIADNTPFFDFNNGVMNIPYVATDRGAFSATLRYIPGTYDFSVNLNNDVKLTTIPGDTRNPVFFNFGTGVLSIPRANTNLGIFNLNLGFVSPNIFRLQLPTVGTSNLGNCPMFPANNFWNTRVDTLRLHAKSNNWINNVRNIALHPDFGSFASGSGQPINFVAGSKVPQVNFNFEIPSESDNFPYPVPNVPLRENTSDNRMFIVNSENCNLYEFYNAQNTGTGWRARRGSVFNLNSNGLRPSGWGSADEGGFATVPGLIRFEEVNSGVINHALRFTFPDPNTRIWPARHVVGAEVPVNDSLPMGARLRLRSDFDINGFAPEVRVILQAMKTYGIVLTDDGSSRYLFLSGTPDDRWIDDVLVRSLHNVRGGDFEVVDSECLMVNPDSGEADLNRCK